MAGTGPSGERAARAASLLRDRSGVQRVTNIELFFDLVYVFAVTQLSHYLLDHPTVRGALQANYERILAWCTVSGALAVGGGFAHGYLRDVLWLLAVGVDLTGGVVGFAVPGLGASRTADWTIEGGHFAERCQAFILIALGESVVIIGATLGGQRTITASAVAAFVVAFGTSVALWWLYFDQSAEAAAEAIARSPDPGRLGRSAYHLVHPIMVAGIIVTAAADEKVLSDPAGLASPASAWMILGGPALFLAGHVAFKFVVWRYVSWPRVGGIVVLALLALAARSIPALALAACAAALVTAVAATDRLPWLPHPATD